ncbi:GNAT family N-acetyltransferase [Haploplasma axanthum]|nr:GNAT family N-acetyltransferase [Haploplasma axanthum]
MRFNEKFDEIKNDKIMLKIIEKNQGNENTIPFYYYDIYLLNTNKQIGKISIRIGNDYSSYYNGNIGFEINKDDQGNNYSYHASKLVIEVAKYHGMEYLNLSCEHDNIASSKIIEKLGSVFIEETVPPKDYVFYYEGISKHKIYRLSI